MSYATVGAENASNIELYYKDHGRFFPLATRQPSPSALPLTACVLADVFRPQLATDRKA